MTVIRRVAVFGASGNFGTPITVALREAGFEVTIITRADSMTPHPSGLPLIRTEYTLEKLTQALAGQDAAVCVVGPAGIVHQVTLIDAAEAAGVKRFLIDDFGWGLGPGGMPEFEAIQAQRTKGRDHAIARAEANAAFTWTGISIGNPIDWALKKFPLMGFDIAHCSAIIYDDGTQQFTGTTLRGIGQSVVGVMQHPDETANRSMKVFSLRTNQNELLDAFQRVTGQNWHVQRSTTEELKASGKSKFKTGTPGWVLELVVAQLFGKDESRRLVAPSREASDSELLGIREEGPVDVVEQVLLGK